MQSLTLGALVEAMALCCKNINYKVCIVFASRSAMLEFIAELRKAGRIPNVRRAITCRTDCARLDFFNGSVIEILPMTESNLRGKKCNRLIVSGVSNDEVQRRLEMMLFPYRSDEYGTERVSNAALLGLRSQKKTTWQVSDEALPIETETEQSEALDAFLDSFVVNKSVNKTAL